MRPRTKSAYTVFGTWAINDNHHPCHHPRNAIVGRGVEGSRYFKSVSIQRSSYFSNNMNYNYIQVTGQSESCILWQQWLVQGGGVDLKRPMRVLSWDLHRIVGRRLRGFWKKAGFLAALKLYREKSSNLSSKTEAISNFQQSSLIFILFPLELNSSG